MDPLELELQEFPGCPACYMGAWIQTLVIVIVQQALLSPSHHTDNLCLHVFRHGIRRGNMLEI